MGVSCWMLAQALFASNPVITSTIPAAMATPHRRLNLISNGVSSACTPELQQSPCLGCYGFPRRCLASVAVKYRFGPQRVQVVQRAAAPTPDRAPQAEQGNRGSPEGPVRAR